ncbi:hypothetical protein ACSYAD_18520 [Acaryochloris marina NIES-2412]|uniref:hypothetical protein n=1 Tax=Acaryochloris marina TaxID=155978 RepID=UPI004058A61A
MKKPENSVLKRPQSLSVSTFESQKTPIFAKYRYQVPPSPTNFNQVQPIIGGLWLDLASAWEVIPVSFTGMEFRGLQILSVESGVGAYG